MFTHSFDAVIVGNGSFPKSTKVRRFIRASSLVISCDGGTNALVKAGFFPNWIVGDGDSISQENKERFGHIFEQQKEQESNDQTKAVKFCLHLLAKQGLKRRPRILILAATGKREDHTLGNISLIYSYFEQADVITMSDYGYFEAFRDTAQWDHLRLGQQLSIFNLDAKGLQGQGLKYPVYDFKELWQGTLNEVTAPTVTLSAQGRFLVYLAF